MKKTYMKPVIDIDGMEAETIICASQGVTSGNGIGYGGVDENGSKDPASRREFSVWDEEWANE